MSVITKYYSDKDPDTMFENEAEANGHDVKLEKIGLLRKVLTDSAKAANVTLEENDAFKIAEFMFTGHIDDLSTVFATPKERKKRISSNKQSAKAATGGKNSGTEGPGVQKPKPSDTKQEAA